MDNKGFFEKEHRYIIKEKGTNEEVLYWLGGANCEKSSSFDSEKYSIDGEAVKCETYILFHTGEKRLPNPYGGGIYEEPPKEEQNYSTYTVMLPIPRMAGSEYHVTFGGETECIEIRVPHGKKLTIQNILSVDLETGEYELPEEYVVEEFQETQERAFK